tara:strand:- start:19920 stop:20171 length:252 start_codon:yes stop_codon:yes gene_type:complete
MNAFQSEQYNRKIKQLGIITPIKYVEKGLMNDSQSNFDEYYDNIKERLIMANVSEKTRSRYLRQFENESNKLEILFNHVKSIV